MHTDLGHNSYDLTLLREMLL